MAPGPGEQGPEGRASSRIVAGRYRVGQLLGQGGFGTVHRAEDMKTGAEVALKRLLTDGACHGATRARFEREADLASRLKHPSTVRLLDYGVDDDTPYIAWELLRGRGLDDVIADGPLEPLRVARIAAQVLCSLAEAHGLAIIHRDIKPANIFLCLDGGDLVSPSPSGRVELAKVLDFGIAKLLVPDSEGERAALTQRGEVPGTPRYMAPEQVMCMPLTPAVDLYAVGLVIAEAISGRPVFASESGLDVLRALLSDDPTPLSRDVWASPLGLVIDRATRKKASERYANAGEMRAAIEEAARGLRHARPGPTLLAPTSANGPDTVMPDTLMPDTERPDRPSTLRTSVAGETPAPPEQITTSALAVSELAVSAIPIVRGESHAALAIEAPTPPPPRPRPSTTARWGLMALAAVSLLLVGTLVIAKVVGADLGEPSAQSAVSEPVVRHGPMSMKALDAPGALEAALIAEGWTTTATPRMNNPGSSSLGFSVVKGTRSGMVMLMRFSEESVAISQEGTMKLQSELTCKRSGTYFLCVSLSSGAARDARAGKELLAAIAR